MASEPGEFLVRSTSRSGAADVENAASSTQSSGRLINRFSSYMLPLVVTAAAFGAPAPPAMRRIFSRAGVSRSEVGGIGWFLDQFAYTEELATIEQVRALNALLALPVVEGFPVDLAE
jgi:hypothetical protein